MGDAGRARSGDLYFKCRGSFSFRDLEDLFAHVEQMEHNWWSGIRWNKDDRRAENFESADVLLMDWDPAGDAHHLLSVEGRQSISDLIESGALPHVAKGYPSDKGMHTVVVLERTITDYKDYIATYDHVAAEIACAYDAARAQDGRLPNLTLDRKPRSATGLLYAPCADLRDLGKANRQYRFIGNGLIPRVAVVRASSEARSLEIPARNSSFERDFDRAVKALARLGSDVAAHREQRDDGGPGWIGVILALHSLVEEHGAEVDESVFELADAWSSQAAACDQEGELLPESPYRGRDDVRQVWDSLTGTGGARLGLGSLIRWAQHRGSEDPSWEVPRPWAKHVASGVDGVRITPITLPTNDEVPGIRDADQFGDLVRLRWAFERKARYIERIGWAWYRNGRFEIREDLEAVMKTRARALLMGTGLWLQRQAFAVLAEAKAACPDDLAEATAEQIQAVEAAKAELKEAKRIYGRSRSPGPVGAAVADFRNHVTVPAAAMDDPDRARGLLVVANGTLNLRTGELSEHDPELLLTKASPATWNPQATSPTWDKFLHDLYSGDKELIRWHLAFLYLALCGDGEISTASVLIGPGGGGRGTFMDAVAAVFGDYAHTAPWSMLQARRGASGHTDDLARARGCRVLLFGETGEDIDLVRFKSLTGDTYMDASLKGEKGFRMRRTWLVMLAGQGILQTAGDSGMRRRLAVTQTTQSFSERDADVEGGLAKRADPTLGRRIRAERDGILRSIVEGRHFLVDGRLPRCAAIERATASHMEATGDPIRDFLFLAVERGTPYDPDTGLGAYIIKSDLYRAYVAHAEQELGGRYLSKTRFWKAVHKLVKTNTEVRVKLLGLELGADEEGLPTIRSRRAGSGEKPIAIVPSLRMTRDGDDLLHMERE